MPTQEIQTVTKETQKVVLKALCEFPTLSVEELTLFIKNRGGNVSQEEITQVFHSISPNKNWHRMTQEDIQSEILNYVWTLETQILFLLPTKQKETTIAEFNQVRLQNKQTKVPKDIVRHVQTMLVMDNKNLSKFRKFQKDLSFQNDLDPNIQASWAIRIILSDLNTNLVPSVQELPELLIGQLKEKFPNILEKIGKTSQRLVERIIEKYFSKSIDEKRLKDLIILYQSIHHTYKKSLDGGETVSQTELYDQNKMIHTIIDNLKETQEIIKESHEGGFLSKLFTGSVKNKEGIIKKINDVINSLNQINDLNSKTNKNVNDKALLIQKLQSDYENIVMVKNQLETDLYNLNEKLIQLESKELSSKNELESKNESLEKAHEKIALLQQKTEKISELESKTNMLREELNIAKDISVRLYGRINRLKSDLLKQTSVSSSEKPKNNHKTTSEPKISSQTNNFTIHKVQQDETTGKSTITTETTENTSSNN